MNNKVLTKVAAIGLVIALTGCGAVENQVKVEAPKAQEITQQSSPKEKAVSEIPGFDTEYKDIVEIDIAFDPETVRGWGGGEGVRIKDGKMINDILYMIGQSDLMKDDTVLNKMSGMASKNNKLTFIAKDKSKREMIFAYDDPAFAVGYLDINGKKYDPGFSFFRYIRDFTEYRGYDTGIETQVLELFKKYNWTVDYRIKALKETLPDNLKHKAGEYPVKIYWAYNNELSKSIGLDYGSYLGKTIDVDIYRLREPLPEFMHPRMDARGIILKYEGKIIGAYIDAGRHDCFACSLDRKTLKDITNKEWDNWIGDYTDYTDELEIKLSRMSPEGIIKFYYEAMDRGDEKTQFACRSRQSACGYLAMNMDNNKLFNESFAGGYIGGENNVESANLIKMSELKGMDNPKGTIEFSVTVDFKFKKVITSDSGVQQRFILLRKESEKSGWRICSEGTGP